MPSKKYCKEKFVLITEEVEVCKRLSSNDSKVRRKGLAALRHLLKNIDNKKAVDVEDYDRIWNGIFNYVWMSDKPLVQEEDVESISNLIHVIKVYESAMLFVRGFFHTIATYWNRISHHRTDKFLMFVRRFLRQILVLLKNSEWDSKKIELFSRELYSALQILPLSVILHINDIYNEEIAKVSEGNIPTSALALLFKCYVECIFNMKPSMQVVNNINNSIFCSLVRQMKLYIKQQAVVADELIDEGTISNENSSNRAMLNNAWDPRPGNVDVYLPFISFDEHLLVDFLKKYHSRSQIPIKAKNMLSQIIQMFRNITNLRKSMNNPVKVLWESKQNKRKRKKKYPTMASLIKKSCQKLEIEEAEFESKTNKKILKKLEKLNAIQVPETKGKINKRKEHKWEGDQTNSEKWTVTKNSEDKTEHVSLNNSQDWTVTEISEELQPNIDCISVANIQPSNSSLNDSQNIELIIENPPSNVSSLTENTKIDDKQSELFKNKNDDPEDDKENGNVISHLFKKQIVSEENDEIPKTKRSRISSEENTRLENVITPEENLSELPLSGNLCKEQEIIVKRSSSSFTEISSTSVEKNIAVTMDKPVETVSTHLVLNTNLQNHNEKIEQDNRATTKRTQIDIDKNNDIENLDIVSIKKKKLSVSFNLEPVSITYDVQNEEPSENINNVHPIIVPSSEIKNRSNLLKSDESYTTVDFSSKTSKMKENLKITENEDESNIQVPKTKDDKKEILTSDNQIWTPVSKEEIIEVVSQNENNEDSDYDLSSLFPSPPESKKRRQSIRKPLIQVKRSERLANKAAAAKLLENKKVSFTRKNRVQEVYEHLILVKLKPEVPYNASKIPLKSILKPFAVPSPINPFYYSNGERKLKKKVRLF